MGLFDFFSNKEDNALLAKILSLAEVILPQFQKICSPTTLEGQFEVYMFNVVYLWDYFTFRQLLNPTNSIINKKILYLHDKSRDFRIDLKQKDFVKLYERRYVEIQREIKFLSEPDYLSPKPAYIFSVIYYNQLELSPVIPSQYTQDSYNDLFGNKTLENRYYELTNFSTDFRTYVHLLDGILSRMQIIRDSD